MTVAKKFLKLSDDVKEISDIGGIISHKLIFLSLFRSYDDCIIKRHFSLERHKIYQQNNRTEQNRTEQNTTEHNRTQQNRTENLCVKFYCFLIYTVHNIS
jgi:hypothetical protein